MKVKIINQSTNSLPTYETVHSAGLDLRADCDIEIIIKPMERKLIGTGIFIELPEGYEAQIRPRSGLALKYGITILNSPGTIDADYRGELKILLINLSSEDFIVKKGDRIAQMIINRYEKIQWEEVAELSDTQRGTGGYGHTGKN